MALCLVGGLGVRCCGALLAKKGLVLSTAIVTCDTLGGKFGGGLAPPPPNDVFVLF